MADRTIGVDRLLVSLWTISKVDRTLAKKLLVYGENLLLGTDSYAHDLMTKPVALLVIPHLTKATWASTYLIGILLLMLT